MWQNQIPRVLDGLGISILSTSKGVISNKAAKRLGVANALIVFELIFNLFSS